MPVTVVLLLASLVVFVLAWVNSRLNRKHGPPQRPYRPSRTPRPEEETLTPLPPYPPGR